MLLVAKGSRGREEERASDHGDKEGEAEKGERVVIQVKPGSNSFGNTASSAQSQPTQTSSLFANTQTQPPSAPNVTGVTTSQPQQSSSLFPGPGVQQTKPNPFPSLSNNPQPQQQTSAPNASNPFAPAGSQPQQTSNLFGTSLNATSSQPTASTLFPPQQPQQQPQQQQQPQPGQAQQQDDVHQGPITSKGAQPAYFDNLLEKGRKRMRNTDGGPGFQDLPSLQLGLGDIAKRVREIGGVGGAQTRDKKGADSKAHYLLAASGIDPGTARRDLDSLAVLPSTTETLSQADEWEPDAHRYIEQLQQRQTVRMVSEGLERAQKRFDAFLEENVDMNWELQRKRIYEHFGLTPRDPGESDEFANHSAKGSFGHSKRRSKSGKAAAPGGSTLSRSIFARSGLQKSVIGTPGVGSGNATLFADVPEKNGGAAAGPDDRYLREKQRKYAQKVYELNQARLRRARIRDSGRQQESPYPILHEFSTIENQPGGDSPRQITDAYKTLIMIAKEGEANERQYADDYLDEMPNSAKSMKIRKQIIDGSRRSLESAFLEQLEMLVARNPKEASLGGIPTAVNKVRAYVRIRASRKDLAPDGLELAVLGDDYCWALIFYLLRSGMVKAAAEYVVNNASHFKTLDRNIITFLTAFARHPERRLEGRVQRECNNVYSAMTKVAPGDSIDPYKIACYKIIGRCELSKRSIDHVCQGVEDWIWLQFNLAREVNRSEESAADVFGLEDVRETIREIGQRHFSKGAEGLGGYGTYFYLQILGGMFEQAVSYLYTYSYTVAIHFAVALDYYGFLRVADWSVSETELCEWLLTVFDHLSFARMLGYYTRDFRASNVEAAVDYLALLCLNADLSGQLGRSQADLCHEALRELVLETREFARLLGDIRSDGTRVKGAIEERLGIIGLANQEDFLKTVTIQAASVADDNGRITDAVLLYHLSEDYDNVINILNRALSEALSLDISTEPTRLQPLKPRAVAVQEQDQQMQRNNGSSLSLTSVEDPYVLAKNMSNLYGNNVMYLEKIRPVNRDSCDVLMRMSEARANVIAGKWAEAYEVLLNLNLLPLRAGGNIPEIRASSGAFNLLPHCIARLIGPLLLWTITCIGRQRENLANKQYGGEGSTSRELSEALLSAAKDLMVFAGLVKYRLGERVWEAVCSVAGDTVVY
ncbi:MAG: hypothetical protein Q9163_000445 [Psora crenata]